MWELGWTSMLCDKKLINFQSASCWSMRPECRKSHDRCNRLDVRTSSWPLNVALSRGTNSTQKCVKSKKKQLKSNSAALEKIPQLWTVLIYAKNSHSHYQRQLIFGSLNLSCHTSQVTLLAILLFWLASPSQEQVLRWCNMGLNGSLRPNW